MARVEANVVYGMYSGLALLLDVHHHEQPKGYGIMYIAGSGWSAPLSNDAAPLKDPAHGPPAGRAQATYGEALTTAGYTVFAINHRATPRFRYPAAVEDAQRAVRFVRFHADRFGVHADLIGALGGSSGGHLVSLLGVLDGAGDPAEVDPVNRESGRVQCVVARAGAYDFLTLPAAPGPVTQFLGMLPSAALASREYRTYQAASPVTHVTAASAPFLLLHGDADPLFPFRHAERMLEVLEQAEVPVKLVRIEGGGHGPEFPGAVNPPDYLAAMVHWFDEHLAVPRAATAVA